MSMLLLTWTPDEPKPKPKPKPGRQKAKVYRTDADRWVVLIRDIAHAGTTPKFVTQRDFDFLADAMEWARQETGQEPVVSI